MRSRRVLLAELGEQQSAYQPDKRAMPYRGRGRGILPPYQKSQPFSRFGSYLNTPICMTSDLFYWRARFSGNMRPENHAEKCSTLCTCT